MGTATVLRALTTAEREELERRRRSRAGSKRDGERATIVLLRAEGLKIRPIAQQVGRSEEVVVRWLKRFNEEGLAGLEERAGRGRRPTYSQSERGQMIAVARTQPAQLGQAYNYWSLRRLADYMAQAYDIKVSKSQLACILRQEGLRWYQEKTYFTQRPDPDFAEKRGR